MGRYQNFVAAMLVVSLTATGCGGSSGGDNSVEDSTPLAGDGSISKWKIAAPVFQDNCGERVATVNQTISVMNNGDSLTVDTTIVTVNGTKTSDGFSFGFQETNGDCTRNYSTQFTNSTDTTADVHIAVSTSCGSFACQDEWKGTAARVN